MFAQDAAPPSASPPDGVLQPPPKPNAEMQTWLETVDAQWQVTFAKEVTAPFDAEKTKLALQYMAGLEANVAKASGAGNLDLTILWRNERDRFASAKDVPAEDEAAAPPELKQLRAAWRTQAVRLEKDRAERAKLVHARYDQVLGQAQTQLTQRQRIEDALLVKNKRDEVIARWQAAPLPADAPIPVKQEPPATAPQQGTASARSATPAPNIAALKSLFTGSRWQWFDTPDLKGKASWVEFYRDGAMYSSWGEAYRWEIIPPATIKMESTKPNSRAFFMAVDLAKKEARPDPGHRPIKTSILYEKRVSSIPPKDVKF